MPIPAGTFTMGSPATEAGRRDNEGPQTRVTISQAFWLGQTEVTHGQWRAIMGTDLTEQMRRMLPDDMPYGLGGKQQAIRDFLGVAKYIDSKKQLYNTGDDVPMHFVGWEEAVAFCRKLMEREHAAGRVPAGYEYRLPTEAEWEYGCRAGTTEATYAGEMENEGKNNSPMLDRIAWYGGNSKVGYTGDGPRTEDRPEEQSPGGDAGPHEVAKKQPNEFGLYDTLGDVWEWCGDWNADKRAGGDVRDPVGPASGSRRVIRGGRWANPPAIVRAACRSGDEAGVRVDGIGYRLALAPQVSR